MKSADNRKASIIKKKGRHTSKHYDTFVTLEGSDLEYVSPRGKSRRINIGDCYFSQDEDSLSFKVHAPGRTHEFEAANVNDKKDWISRLEKAGSNKKTISLDALLQTERDIIDTLLAKEESVQTIAKKLEFDEFLVQAYVYSKTKADENYQDQMKKSIQNLKKKEKELQNSKDKDQLRIIRKQIADAEEVYSKICDTDQQKIEDSYQVQIRKSIAALKKKEKELQNGDDKDQLRNIRKQISEAEEVYSKICSSDQMATSSPTTTTTTTTTFTNLVTGANNKESNNNKKAMSSPNEIFAKDHLKEYMSGIFNVPWWIAQVEKTSVTNAIHILLPSLSPDLICFIIAHCMFIPTAASAYTISFNDHKKEPWGMSAHILEHWTKWAVINITPHKKAHKMGVESGDMIIAIDGIDLDNSNYKPMRELLIHGTACNITFAKQGAGHMLDQFDTKVIDLNNKDMNLKTIDEIGYQLLRNKTFTKLDLSSNPIGDFGARCIGAVLITNLALIDIKLARNDITDIGATVIAHGLETNSTLIIIDLHGNKISDVGARAIAKALAVNTTLAQINLDSNSLTEQGISLLSEHRKKTRWYHIWEL